MVNATAIVAAVMKTKTKLWAAYLGALGIGFCGILENIPMAYCLGYFIIATFILTTILEID